MEFMRVTSSSNQEAMQKKYLRMAKTYFLAWTVDVSKQKSHF